MLIGFLFLFTGACHWLGAQDPPSPTGVATAEVYRRKQMLDQAQQLIQAGSMAQSDQDYGGALDNFRAAFELLPEAPAVEATRRVVFKRYQSAAVQHAQQMIDEAQWPQAKQVLQDVLTLGNEAGYGSSMDPGLKRMLANLEDPEYYPTVLSPQHIKRVERVKELLLLGQGYLDYGNFDQAAKTFNQVLTIDRYNEAARRGIEDVERHKMNYFAVARDQTRATKLREVSEGWEMPVPRAINIDSELATQTPATSRRQSLEEKLKIIKLPSLEFQEVRLSEALELLRQRSVELYVAETDFSLKGINLNLDTGTFAAGENPGDKTVSLRLSNVSLEAALKYLTQLSGTTYQIDDFGIRVVSLASGSQQVMQNRTWTVPPGFLGRSGLGNGAQLNADPFGNADQGAASGVLVKRKTAREFLEENGIVFGEGAIANYNPASSTLLVRNTTDQLAMIDNLVQAAKEGVNKMVEVSLKMISITQDMVKQLGVDTLLGPSNLGSSPRVFTSGGTNGGNTPNDFAFLNPGGTPVGTFPVSSSLRTGDLQSSTSIDDVLTSAQPTTSVDNAPAVFSVGGVFTDPQFQATLRMFTQSKGTDFLCDTKLLIRPGQRGKVEVIREFIYPTEYDPPEIPNQFGGGTTNFPVSPATPTAFEMRPVGKTLEVEATVSDDNHTVNLDLSVFFTDFSGFVNYGTPIIGEVNVLTNVRSVLTDNRILMPVFDVVRETTNISLWDGQTVAIGGIHGHTVTDTQDKIPFIGDLPVLGRMFRSSTEDHRKTAIFIFATVRLIDPAGIPINAPAAEEPPNEFPPRSNLPTPPRVTDAAMPLPK